VSSRSTGGSGWSRWSPDVVRRRATRAVRRSAYNSVRRWRNRPPIVSRQWSPAPPDFVGIGVQRAGTSWWYSLLQAHPQVHGPAEGKEAHYFERFWRDQFTEADVAGYHELFRRPAGKRCGEWTPRYMFDAWTPPLLHRAAPEARLLVMLRDPVERFRSGLTHSLERGRTVDAATVDEALSRSLYHAQLAGFLRHFPRSQVLVLQYERCTAEPVRMLRRTHAFLELAEQPPATAAVGRVNVTAIAKLELPAPLMSEVRARLGPDVEQLAAEFPEIDLGLWPNFGS
jgi:hypothetical protein